MRKTYISKYKYAKQVKKRKKLEAQKPKYAKNEGVHKL